MRDATLADVSVVGRTGVCRGVVRAVAGTRVSRVLMGNRELLPSWIMERHKIGDSLRC